MASTFTKGENWIKFLRAYGPVADDSAQELEQLVSFSEKHKIPRLSFEHPFKRDILDAFKKKETAKVAIITGTAGDGKTTMCYEIVKTLTGEEPNLSLGLETFTTIKAYGSYQLTLIYDLTGWGEIDPKTGELVADQVEILEKAALYSHGKGGNAFLMAVNDGQLHEINKALPDNCTDELKAIFKDLLSMHGEKLRDSKHYIPLQLINLSFVASDQLMTKCLENLLKRKEWNCLKDETDRPLFSQNSSIPANYEQLHTQAVKDRLISIAKIADANNYHIPIRSITLLLVNILLGHREFTNNLAKPGVESERVFRSPNHHNGALHINLFGHNLTPNNRNKRLIFQFLNNLRVGEETTNDVDELIIYGARDKRLKDDYDKLIEEDNFNQRDPILRRLVDQYIKGEMDDSGIENFRRLLAEERKRVFLHSANAKLINHSIWVTTIFHHTHDYINKFFDPVQNKQEIKGNDLLKLVNGLNRVWTGLLVKPDVPKIHLATGLDINTAPISDLLIKDIELVGGDTKVTIEKVNGSVIPEFMFKRGEKVFSFPLTLLRFEFLYRVSEGAMPTCFSNEVYTNFLTLKQTAIRQLDYEESTEHLCMINLTEDGQISTNLLNLNHYEA